jgi:Lrp/AsnC family transcriptional regulator, leucine-responsive regulatory protein
MIDPLDEFDRKILEIVQLDCRAKAETIGDMVGLSASAIQRRLKRLRDCGVISAEIAVVDRSIAGNLMTFIVGMEIERENHAALSKFGAWADEQLHIQQAYYVTGSVDLIAVIIARDVAQFDEITTRLMSENPQIKRLRTNVAFKNIKLGMYAPIVP